MMEFLIWLAVLGALAKIPLSFLGFAAGALVFGSMWFWILLVVAMGAVFAFIDHEDGIGATGTLVLFLLLLHRFGDISAFSFVSSHPYRILGWASAYFVLGTLWSFAKWWFHCRAQRDLYNEKKKQGNSYGVPSKPNAAESKDTILRWMTFWPWSMIWTLINDPIKKAFREIFRRLQARFQAIADKAWDGIPQEKA
jgi:hypothetical protein